MIKNTKKWNGKTDVLLNLIKENVSDVGYKNDVPEADFSDAEGATANIHDIGNIITSNNSYTELFYDNLYGVIGMQIVSGWHYTNKFKAFKKGLMQIGDVIQITRPKAFTGHNKNKDVSERSGSDVDSPERHGVDAQYFARNIVATYHDTVDREELKRAFASVSSFETFVTAKLTNIYNMYEVDEQLVFKYLVITAINHNNAKTVTYTKGASDEENAKNIIKAVKNTCGKMTFPSTDYNLAKVLNAVNSKSELNVIMPVDINTNISVDALAGAFNLDKMEMTQKLYEIDNFELSDYEKTRLTAIGVDCSTLTMPENVACIIFADDFFQIYDNLYEMYTRLNESGLFQNYFLHVWQTWAVSEFAQFAVVKQGE